MLVIKTPARGRACVERREVGALGTPLLWADRDIITMASGAYESHVSRMAYECGGPENKLAAHVLHSLGFHPNVTSFNSHYGPVALTGLGRTPLSDASIAYVEALATKYIETRTGSNKRYVRDADDADTGDHDGGNAKRVRR